MANNDAMALSAEEKDSKKNLLGHYKLVEKIAQGGMAEIYKAETYDPNGLRREVVIKRILPHISSQQEFIDMLIDEAKIAVQFNHGNIAQIYDLGKVSNDYFIVMEYVEGKTLQQLWKRAQALQTRIPLPYCLYFTSELCAGLAYMHRKTDADGKPLHVVHRDISPQNLIITTSGNLKIIDFGVAKAADKMTVTESGVLKGKFAYMSPEQAVGDDIDHRSDIFSAGIILWEIASGERLFRKKSNKETLKAIKKADVPTLVDYCPEAPKALDKIIRKALARSLRKRYQNAEDLQIELLRVLYAAYPDFKPSQAGAYVESLFRPAPATELETPPDASKDSSLADDDKTRNEKIRLKEPPPPRASLKEGPPEEVTVRHKKSQAAGTVLPFEDIQVGEETVWVRRDEIDLSPAIAGTEDKRRDQKDPAELEPTTAYPPGSEDPTQDHSEEDSEPRVELGLIDKPVGSALIPRPQGAAESSEPSSRLKGASAAPWIWGLALVLVALLFGGGTVLWRHFTVSKPASPADSVQEASPPASLHVVVTPKEAEVRLDGRTLKRDDEVYTAIAIDSRLPHTLSVAHTGYRSFTLTYTFKPAEEKWLDITLPELPKPEPPSQPTYGFIVVESDPPGASIFLDDKETGKTTPAIVDGLETDTPHRVGLSGKGLKYFEETVKVAAGETKTVSAKLEANKGSFSFMTDPPGAYVRVNGELVGQSPVLNYEIQPGTIVELRYTNPGYEEWSKTFQVFGGERERIFQKLKPLDQD